MTIADALETSLADALACGCVDPKRHAALIEAARAVAARADTASEKDNVAFPTLLKYLAALGLTLDDAQAGQPKTESKTQRLKSKYKRVSA